MSRKQENKSGTQKKLSLKAYLACDDNYSQSKVNYYY